MVKRCNAVCFRNFKSINEIKIKYLKGLGDKLTDSPLYKKYTGTL